MRSLEVTLGVDADPRVRWELSRLAELDVLEKGEILCDVEEVIAGENLGSLNGLAGVLVVTDLRVFFLRTGVTRRRTEVESIALNEVGDVRASASSYSWPFKRGRGALVISRHGNTPASNGVEFEQIRGGQARAEELARTILYQRDVLRSEPGRRVVEPSDEAISSSEVSAAERTQTVLIGRGVASYVNSHGGCLYVWGDPVGGFEWMKASTERPEGVELALVASVREFELCMEKDLIGARRLRLARRWWLPGGGVVVDTGLVVGA